MASSMRMTLNNATDEAVSWLIESKGGSTLKGTKSPLSFGTVEVEFAEEYKICFGPLNGDPTVCATTQNPTAMATYVGSKVLITAPGAI